MNGRPWTTGEARRLAQLREQRTPIKRIAAELDRTENAVWEFLRYVPASPGIPAHKQPVNRLPKAPPKQNVRDDYWKRDELAMLRQFASDGSSAKDVAAALGRTPAAVRSKAWLEGVRFNGGGQNRIFRLEQESTRFRRNAEHGSAALLEALLELVA